MEHVWGAGFSEVCSVRLVFELPLEITDVLICFQKSGFSRVFDLHQPMRNGHVKNE